ncbi:GNAT family N-acetyltransferase [Photobacterium sp. MCCC 1A19761]|uniref:GNAT family N-acetyltransferase n=1 Tax=Photobacterium sp. MCCC 1A19761 TaxID=3115000 RepID=UPI00307F8FEE
MEISQAVPVDAEAVVRLIKDVSQVDILPDLSEAGKQAYRSSVLLNIEQVFDNSKFYCLKAVMDGEVVGFGALRDGNYLTHLFISKQVQGSGLGKQLLGRLLHATNAREITLRSSVNAVGFYQAYGFERTGEESQFHGIRFVPMRLMRQDPAGSRD